MSDLPSPEEVKDLAASIQALASSVDEIKKGFKGVNSSTQSWNNILEEANLSLKDLPGHIQTGKDLWKEMLKDQETAKKLQEDINKLIEADYLPQIEEAQRMGKEGLLDSIQLTKEKEQLLDVVSKHVDLAERIRNHEEETVALMGDANKLVKDLGGFMRDPAAGAENLLASMGKLPQKLADAKKETGSWFGALKKVGGDGLGPITKLFAGGGLLLGGIAIATIAFTGFFMLFKNFYNFLDKEVMPAVAKFNQEIGGSGKEVSGLKTQMMSVGSEFELLGYSFAEGAKLVTDFAKAYNTIDISSEDLKTAKDLVAVVGLTAEQAGQMALQFSKQEGSLDGLREMFTHAEQGAAALGLPVNQVLKDLADAPDAMVRFGTKGRLAFADAGNKAREFGLTIKDVNAAFGKQFDSFEKSSTAAANFNAVLGTNINSYELMMETNPTERLKMVRGELVKNGKEWENLSVFEKNMITQNLGVTDSQAALILSSEKQRKKLKQQQAAQESLAKTTATWDRGVGRIKKTLIAWGKELDYLMREATKFVFALLGFEKPGKVIPELTAKMSVGFRELKTIFASWTEQLKGSYEEAGTFVKVLKVLGKGAQIIWGILELGGRILYKNTVAVLGFVGGLLGLDTAWEALTSSVADGSLFEMLEEGFDYITKLLDDFKLLDFGEIWGAMIAPAKKVWADIVKYFEDNADAITQTLTDVFTDPFAAAADMAPDFLKGFFSGDSEAKPPATVKTAVGANTSQAALAMPASAPGASGAPAGASPSAQNAAGQDINVALNMDGQQFAKVTMRNAVGQARK